MDKYHKDRKRPHPVRAKKHLGQHFLTDQHIAGKIADSLSCSGYRAVLEIGPGTGILTDQLLTKDLDLTVMDIDAESIEFLHKKYENTASDIEIIHDDFLKADLLELMGNQPFAVIGNFPYNISTQIVFKVLENKELIPEFAGMFQKEVAERICHESGSKTYGILSVLTQAYYEAEYLFTVPPEVFNPPPKVDSGVLRLIRKKNLELSCDETLFYKVVKTAFNQRRKTLRNSLKSFKLSDNLKEDTIFDRRPEQLSVAEFITLTAKIGDDTV